MEESPRPGKPSSLSPCAAHDERLRALASAPEIDQLSRTLGTAPLFLVGGCVRDTLAGGLAHDLDLTTPLRPSAVVELLSRAGLKVIETGLHHGTVLAVIDGRHIEITTFRRSPKAAGPIELGDSLDDDLAARDFTINAIAYDVRAHILHDPEGGQRDLIDHRVRAVRSPEKRFAEDPLRCLRMIRFGPAAGRSVDPATLAAATQLAARLTTVSPERIRDELCRILLSRFVIPAFRMLHSTGLLHQTIPELEPSVGFEQNQFHDLDVFEHTLKVVENCPLDDLPMRLAALFHDIGKPATLSVDEDGMRHFYGHERVSDEVCGQVLTRLKFSNDQIAAVRSVVRHHMRPVDCGPPGVRRIMRDLGDQFGRWLEFKRADAHGCKGFNQQFEDDIANFQNMVRAEEERRALPSYGVLAVDGYDLQSLGMKPGKLLGAALKHLEELVIEDPQLNAKELLLSRAREWLKQHG